MLGIAGIHLGLAERFASLIPPMRADDHAASTRTRTGATPEHHRQQPDGEIRSGGPE
jgi:hypothetical protein